MTASGSQETAMAPESTEGGSEHSAPEDPLFLPLAGESPAGLDLAASGDMLFDQIQEARRQDDDLPQGIWKIKRKRANWQEVESLCHDALCQRTKDLRLMVWMCEARVQRDSFQALVPVFSQLLKFCETFWADMHPAIEADGDLSARANALEFLDHHLPEILTIWPLTHSGIATPVSYSWGDFETAELYRRKGQESEDIPGTDEILASAAQTPPQHFSALQLEINAAQQAIAALDGYLNQVCGRQAPSFETLKSLLTSVLGWIHTVMPEQEPETLHSAADNLPEDIPAPAANAGMMTEIPTEVSGMTTLAGRDAAYQQISEIADYLEREEPHSPVPYVLRRACSWKNKSLAEILAEVADGSDSLAPILKLFSAPTK